jgi:hypothetical protein
LPYNYAVGVPDGSDFVLKAMKLAIEKYIDHPQQFGCLPTYAAINSTVLLVEISKTSLQIPSHNSSH